MHIPDWIQDEKRVSDLRKDEGKVWTYGFIKKQHELYIWLKLRVSSQIKSDKIWGKLGKNIRLCKSFGETFG